MGLYEKYVVFRRRFSKKYRCNSPLHYNNITYVNWWYDNPANIWFTKFLSAHLKECNCPVAFYSVFGPRKNMKKDPNGISIFFSGENLDPYESFDLPYDKKARIVVNDMKRDYQDYCIGDVDISMGFAEKSDDSYLRFPLWILYLFSPESDKEGIARRVEEINRIAPNGFNKGGINISRHDDFGTRQFICDMISSEIEITYGGKWRNNSTALWDEYGDRKVDFLHNFTYNICPENTWTINYVTEKPFQSIIGGCIPIYAGGISEIGSKIINTEACIILKPGDDNQKQLELLHRLNSDRVYYNKFMEQDKLLPNTVDYVWSRFQGLKKMIQSKIYK